MQQCSETLSVPVGFSDHNLIAMVRKTKYVTVKETPRIAYSRSYKHFCSEKFVHDFRKLEWLNVLSETNPEIALLKFESIFLPIVEKHAPLKKYTIRKQCCPWRDNELKESIEKRNKAKVEARIKKGIRLEKL